MNRAFRGDGDGPREDPALRAALRAGDRSAFERVVRLHASALLAVARRLLRNDDEAREAVQDAFLSAYKARGGFEGASRVSTWLHRIVVNTCLMRLRARSRRPEIPMTEWLPAFKADGHHETTFADWSNAAYAMLEREELCAEVRRAIDCLPESARAVLLLRDIEGVPLEEIAAMLAITPNAVKIRVHRARQALRTLLDPSLAGRRTS